MVDIDSAMLTFYRLTGGRSRWSLSNFKMIGSAFFLSEIDLQGKR